MTAGYVLSHTDYVTLFEADGRLGGHADTHMVVPPAGPPIGVDTGFIVYNERTYPLLTRMFAELGVATQASRDEHVGPLRRLRPAVRGPARPGRPGRRAAPGPRRATCGCSPRSRGSTAPPAALAGRRGRRPWRTQTLGEFLGRAASPVTSPLTSPCRWSPRCGRARRGPRCSYPARYLFAFLANHGMLSVSGSPPWRTVTGGSRCYVERAAKRLHDIRLSTPVRAVRRHHGRRRGARRGRTRRTSSTPWSSPPTRTRRCACSTRPPQAERDVLGAFGYTQNPAMLHTDVTLLPRPPGCQGVVELPARRLRPGPRRRPGSATT